MAIPLISGVTMHLRTGIKQFRRIIILNTKLVILIVTFLV